MVFFVGVSSKNQNFGWTLVCVTEKRVVRLMSEGELMQHFPVGKFVLVVEVR